jgi:hypothetical protein
MTGKKSKDEAHYRYLAGLPYIYHILSPCTPLTLPERKSVRCRPSKEVYAAKRSPVNFIFFSAAE